MGWNDHLDDWGLEEDDPQDADEAQELLYEYIANWGEELGRMLFANAHGGWNGAEPEDDE